MRAAAVLFSNTVSCDSLGDVLHAIGIAGHAPLDGSEIAQLGIDVMHASLVGAPSDGMRALVLRLQPAHTIRDAIPGIARRLASRAPHVLWLIAAIEADGARAGIVGWMAESKGRRL